MNNIYKYDRVMAYSSMYILIPTYYASTYTRLIMIIQTLFSILHWKNYYNRGFHYMDTILSTYTFIHHLVLLRSIDIYYRNIVFLFAIFSLIVFLNRKGYRERVLEKYRVIYVVPHAMFRFLSFWFVMSVYMKDFNIFLSILYSISIYILAVF